MLAVVQFLCASGANPLARDCFGATPLEECERVRRKKLAAVEADDEVTIEETKMKIAENSQLFDRIQLALKSIVVY